ncbi:MAG: SpoIIE family protein phosphatase [Lachnospiraceae bacterium]|nr:SpoIIE family protein phosphatase [Lachnospiraceae bacterium]
MENKKRKPIKRKVQVMVLLISAVSLLITSLVGITNMGRIRNNSRDALLKQTEQSLSDFVKDRADLADSEFGQYVFIVDSFSEFIHDLYVKPQDYSQREVLPPRMENDGIWAMQRALASEDIKLSDIQSELALLGNVESIFSAVAANNKDIMTIYLGTETGIQVAYDPNSGVGVPPEGETETYYDYTERDWYLMGKSGKGAFFTDVYQDTYGRGLNITCGAPFYDEDDNFAGVVCIDVLISDLYKSIVEMDLGDGAYSFLVDGNGNIISEDANERTLQDEIKDEKAITEQILKGETGVVMSGDASAYYAFDPLEKTVSWELCVKLPSSLVLEPVDRMSAQISKAILIFALTFLIILGIVVVSVRKFADSLTRPLLTLGKDVQEISGGNLDYRAKVTENDEVGDLAVHFNDMAASLKDYINNLTKVTAEKERIGAELNVATQIQADMLPRIFPPFPERKEFDLFASMDPAKEVGGDFYDFFLVDDDHIALVVADVSGKGVPAALFMVISKTLIKNRTLMGGSPAEILTYVNNQLCEGNEAELFVTVWLAIIEISTGKGMAANAGHEHPALRRKDGSFELIEYRHSPAVATMEGIRFREHEFELHPGDTLIQYTDGVSEATDSKDELFGNERIVNSLNIEPDAEPKELLHTLRTEIDHFVGDAPQFDDITMLGFKYYGKQ